jgi:hypothetical protein
MSKKSKNKLFVHNYLNLSFLPLFDGIVFPGVQKFIYISVHDYNMPEFPLNNNNFVGKRKVEAEILAAFPSSSVLH